jgi:hypothetical protein
MAAASLVLPSRHLISGLFVSALHGNTLKPAAA